MKKTYQIPTTTVMNVEPQVMMVGSDIKMGDSYNGSSTIESRRGGTLWDEDEE